MGTASKFFFNFEALSLFFTNYNSINNSNNKPFYAFEMRGLGLGGLGASDLSFCFCALTTKKITVY